MASFVIVGAGECGARAALTLREMGFDGAVTMIGTEPHFPYERPPLSKAVLTEGSGPKLVAEPERYQSANIDLRVNSTAVAIDRAARRVVLSDDTTVAYDKLLLSTGARPRALPVIPSPSRRILSLRSFDDSTAIRQHLRPGAHIAILGGGFIGLELAASSRKLGAQVTLLEGLPRVLSRGVPPEIADVVARRHAAEGVRLECGVKISSVLETADGVEISIASDHVLKADILIVGIGAIPNTDLAEGAGLAVDNGIAVDSKLRTSDPEVFAAGDCTSYPLPLYGNRRVRLESWRNAQEQGALAAGNMLGADREISSVPWFWSDQYDLTLQIAGLADGAASTVRRELGDGAFLLFHLGADGSLIAASGIGVGNAVARDIRVAELLIAARAKVDPALLASSETKLKSLLSRPNLAGASA